MPATGTGSDPVKKILIWVNEQTWQAAVDAARELTPEPCTITLLHVTAQEPPDVAQAAYLGLFGRGRSGQDLRARLADRSAASATALLGTAAERLGRPCEQISRTGRTEREVVAAAVGADLLIMVRDGDRARVGPRSLGRATRFAVDHAPCPVLLVWPEGAPPVTRMPPPPPPGEEPPPPPPPGGGPRP
jgi:nucleotide-binding universal stress UspA family protein